MCSPLLTAHNCRYRQVSTHHPGHQLQHGRDHPGLQERAVPDVSHKTPKHRTASSAANSCCFRCDSSKCCQQLLHVMRNRQPHHGCKTRATSGVDLGHTSTRQLKMLPPGCCMRHTPWLQDGSPLPAQIGCQSYDTQGHERHPSKDSCK